MNLLMDLITVKQMKFFLFSGFLSGPSQSSLWPGHVQQCHLQLSHQVVDSLLLRGIVGYDNDMMMMLSYECNYGYMIIGETVRRCERNKVWTGLQPICRGDSDHILITF